MATPLVDQQPALLIVAHSARAIAQSAQRGGFATVALDLFADSDTQAYARSTAQVARAGELALDCERACAVARELASDCGALIYGAGFEQWPQDITRIAAGRRILGNSIECLQRLNDPLAFFALLDEIGFPHPLTQVRPPTDPRGWLRKRCGAQGGWHVRTAHDAPPLAQAQTDLHYYQQKIDGIACSVLFLADAKRARILGYNEQRCVALDAAPYLYAGAVSDCALPLALQRDISTKLDALVAHTGLVGLNSLDFMLHRASYAVLEVNARPPATIDLYDEDSPAGLIDWHVRACKGELTSEALPATRPVRGHAIVFAPRAGTVPPDFAWPPWCSDLGVPGSSITPLAPVCSVHAAGSSAQVVKRLLREREHTLLRLLALVDD